MNGSACIWCIWWKAPSWGNSVTSGERERDRNLQQEGVPAHIVFHSKPQFHRKRKLRLLRGIYFSPEIYVSRINKIIKTDPITNLVNLEQWQKQNIYLPQTCVCVLSLCKRGTPWAGHQVCLSVNIGHWWSGWSVPPCPSACRRRDVALTGSCSGARTTRKILHTYRNLIFSVKTGQNRPQLWTI